MPPSTGDLLYCPVQCILKCHYLLFIILLFSKLTFAVISQAISSTLCDQHAMFLAASSSMDGEVELSLRVRTAIAVEKLGGDGFSPEVKGGHIIYSVF